MSKLEYTDMESIESKSYKDFSDDEDCKKNQKSEQNQEEKIHISYEESVEKISYLEMVTNIRAKGENGHQEILLYLNEINFGIGDFVQKEGKNVTVFRIILENVSNGHDLILQILDSLVRKIPRDKDSCLKCFDTKKDPRAKIEIDLQPMFQQSAKSTDSNTNEFGRSKMRFIRDLLYFQNMRGDDNNTNKIFQHPVIEILILKKWENHQWSYIGKVRFFALIVFLFTFFVRLRLLEEDEKRCINASNVKTTEDSNTTNLTDCVNYLVNISDLTSTWVNSINETDRPFRLLIFKYKETSFVIYAIGMGLVVFIQLFYFLWVLFEACKQCGEKRTYGRIIQYLKICLANMVYLSLVISLVCIHSPIPTLKRYIIVFWLGLFLGEIRQLCFLVFRPAWQGFNSKFIKPILQHRYFRDPENLLELFCIISIPIALYSDAWARNPQDNSDEHDRSLKKEAAFRGIVAIGVFAAWTELFIKLGNVSHSVVGDFTKMFYNIIKTKLLAYMQVCILLIVAFSLAFWIILEGHLKEDGEDFSKGFWFNLVLTVTMSTGEFNTGDFYKNIAENDVIKVFAMLFLMGLVILSTITMINLLVAAIISDYQQMKASVDMENLCFITEYVLEEAEYQRFMYNICKRRMFMKKIYDFFVKKDVEKKITHCPHLICNREICKDAPLPIAKPGWSYNQSSEAGEREPLLLRLLEIRKGKEQYKKGETQENEEDNLCDYHKYGLQWSISGDLITCSVDNDDRTSLEMKTSGTIATTLSAM